MSHFRRTNAQTSLLPDEDQSGQQRERRHAPKWASQEREQVAESDPGRVCPRGQTESGDLPRRAISPV
jgi:hypothetical protein